MGKITITRISNKFRKKYNKSALQVAKTALNEVKNLKKNTEVMHYGKLFARNTVPVTGAYAMELIDLPQGTTQANSYVRRGDEINITSMYMRLGLLYNYNALDVESNQCRLIIGIDKKPVMSGNVCQMPNISDVLEVDASGSNPGITSHLNYTKLSRFQILYDKTHVLSAMKGNKYINFYKKWKRGLNMRFQAPDGHANFTCNLFAFVVSEAQQGSIYYAPTVEASLRMSFIDS